MSVVFVLTGVEEAHELVKEVLKIELQEIDEDNDRYKAKEKVVCYRQD